MSNAIASQHESTHHDDHHGPEKGLNVGCLVPTIRILAHYIYF